MILALYGYGGLGHEIMEMAAQINYMKCKWDDIIALDDYVDRHIENGVDVMSFNEMRQTYSPAEAQVSICVGEPSIREMLYNKLKLAGYEMPVLIHPKVYIPHDSVISQGCLICDGVYISTGVTIDVNTLVNVHTVVGHNVTIGKHTVISPNVAFAGEVCVGDRSYVAMSVPVKEKTHIGNDVVAGMGSVVLRDIPDGMIAMGNPARVIAHNDGNVFGK